MPVRIEIRKSTGYSETIILPDEMGTNGQDIVSADGRDALTVAEENDIAFCLLRKGLLSHPFILQPGQSRECKIRSPGETADITISAFRVLNFPLSTPPSHR